MDILTERQRVVDAGMRLVKEGLVTRTWGNVSLRLDDDHILISPSGIQYDDIRAEDIVLVNYKTKKYEGNRKPSSELNVHIEVYKKRPDVNGIIHTHQMKASIFASARADVKVPADYQDIMRGEIIKTAPYHLPNTRGIARDSQKYMAKTNAVLMANHGTVCAGKTVEQAIDVAVVLEKICEEALL